MARGQRCEERVCHVGHAFFWEAEADRDNPGIRGEAPRHWNLEGTRWPDVPPTSPADTSGSGTGPKVSMRLRCHRPWCRYMLGMPIPEQSALPSHDGQCRHLLGTTLSCYLYIHLTTEEDEDAKRSAENHFEECWGRTSTSLAGECGVGVFHPIFAPLSRYVFALYRLRQSL